MEYRQQRETRALRMRAAGEDANAAYELATELRLQAEVASQFRYHGWPAEAQKWLRKAAELGVSEAQFEEGQLSEAGEDLEGAINWYRKAAALENPEAQMALGNAYQDGKGVSQDVERARDWYTKAAANGDSEAYVSLAYLACTERAPANRVQSLLMKAAEESEPFGAERLGSLYSQGDCGFKRVPFLAYQWLTIAALYGNCPGCARNWESYLSSSQISAANTFAEQWINDHPKR